MTTKVADALLQASPTKSLSRYWRGLDLESVANVVLDLTQQAGHVLPAIRYDGSLVFPVVTLHHDAVASRREREESPVLDVRLLRDLARGASVVRQVRPAVTMRAFITMDRIASVGSTLGRLAGWSRVIAAVPSWTRLSSLSAARCDYYGYTVVASDGAAGEVLINGHAGAKPGASTERDPWLLRWEEQLFDLAIRADAVDWT